MKFSFTILALAVLVPVGAAEKNNPLGEVIGLLDSLTAKITAEGEAEAKAYSEFADWCKNAAQQKGFEIKTATAAKSKNEATIAKLAGDIEAAGSKIDGLVASIAAADADLKDATAIREKEAADYAANEAELVDVVDTLGRAIGILEREMAKNPAAFAQVDTSSIKSVMNALSTVVDAVAISSSDKKKLLNLVQSQQSSDMDDDAPGAPAAALYKTHSGGILDVLEDLKDKAEDQLSELRKAEMNTKHNFNMLKQSLDDQMAADRKALGETKAAQAAAAGDKANAEADLAAAVKDLADAEAALATANNDCQQVAADHASTVAARNEELKTIAEARGILSSTTEGAVGQTYSFLQVQSSLQTRADLANKEVVTIIKRLAKKEHSAALAQLASRISAILRYGGSVGEDPFAKVKSLIADMISKLESEASAEATEKAYCDEQIAKTAEKKEELEADISKLTSKIDVAAANAARLKEEVAELQAELAALAKLQAEMDKNRQDAHAAYVQAKADLEQGLDGVRRAIKVLRDYYGGSAASALLQDGQPAKPELHSKATGAGTSIVGILEVVESDFAKNLATEEQQEAEGAEGYAQMTQDNKVTKTLKDQDVKYKTAEFKGLDKSIAELSADRDSTDAELSAVNEYFSKIKDRCIAKPETYAERARRRQAEIAGLKQALAILEDETAFVQRRKKGGLRRGFLTA